MENLNNFDPLLKQGAFLNPTPLNQFPLSNGNGNTRRTSVEVTDEANRPDWLPPGWRFKETLRIAPSASAGTRDKYFIDPETNCRFRSKKEVFRFLETGVTPVQKRKAGNSDADNNTSAAAKQKKTETTPKPKPTPTPKPTFSIENFKFDEVPEKVKWELTDVYGATWMPKIDDANPIPETTKQEWSAAFSYLSSENGRAMFK